MEQGTVLYIVKLGKLFGPSKSLLAMGQLLIWLLELTGYTHILMHEVDKGRPPQLKPERLSLDANLPGWGYQGNKMGRGALNRCGSCVTNTHIANLTLAVGG